MAECVVSSIVDTDTDRVVSACVVHASHAPCRHHGEPACPTALHTDDSHPSREAAIEFWAQRTRRQRPLIVHRGSLVDDHDTETDEASCWCGPEILGGEDRG